MTPPRDVVARFGLAGRVAIITGGASGIGLGIARVFAGAGACVVLAGRREDVGLAAAEEICVAEDRADAAEFVRTDVTDSSAVRALFARVDADCGGIDVLVNAAGAADPCLLPESDDVAIEAMLAVNLRGVLFCCREAIPRLAARGGGAIVNVASYLGYRGGPGWAPVYSAAKGGVIALTRSLAVTHGPEKVRVNAICPGFVETDLVGALLRATPNPAATLRRIAQEYPLRRLGTPEDMGYAALYLASDAAAWVSGVILPVDGGVTAK